MILTLNLKYAEEISLKRMQKISSHRLKIIKLLKELF